MAKKRSRVEKNPVAGGRPAYDEAPVQNIPRAPGDRTGQSQDLLNQQERGDLMELLGTWVISWARSS